MNWLVWSSPHSSVLDWLCCTSMYNKTKRPNKMFDKHSVARSAQARSLVSCTSWEQIYEINSLGPCYVSGLTTTLTIMVLINELSCSTKNHMTSSLVSTRQLRDNSCGSMMNNVRHTKHKLFNVVCTSKTWVKKNIFTLRLVKVR